MRINADPYKGLLTEQVMLRHREGLTNKQPDASSVTVGQIVRNNVFTYFNLVFCILAVCLMLVGSFNDLMFMIVVVVNTVIGIVQEIRSKRTLDKLSVISNPRTKVVRDGEEKSVENKYLVLDDVIILGAGNQICADATVLCGEVKVNESLITGESNEITKKKGDFLLSGSFVVSGSCRARLDKVGSESYVSKLTAEAKKQNSNKKSEMMRSLGNIVKWIGIILIPVGFLLFFNQHFNLKYSVKESVVSTVGALVGMIPEGLYLLTSVALVVSVMRLAKRKTLVHDLGCIETLARVDMLCVDKTGTITENKMEINEVVNIDESLSDDEINEKLCDFAHNMSNDNITMEAIKEHFNKNNSEKKGRKAEKVFSFSSDTKYSGASFGNDENYVLGAPEFLMGENYEALKNKAEEYAKSGGRVLLFAQYMGTLDGNKLKCDDIVPMSLIVLSNKIRKGAEKTFEYFKNQGVKIKVISGDNPVSVSEISKKAGIEYAGEYVDASTLKTDKDIFEAAHTYTVFGRVTPEQKKKIVIALKKIGYTVAMTGDGVNDVLALKEADCSVAMLSGSDVACHASQLVLLNSDFSSMPYVVSEGRRVINNVERAASLFLIKNIFSLVFALISIFAIFKYPITPSQLTLVSMTTIGIPSFFLALEPNSQIVKGNFMRNVIYRAFPAALTNIFLVLYLIILSSAFNINSKEMSTMTTIIMGVVGLTMLYRICKPFNKLRRFLWISMTLVFILGATLFKTMFSLSDLSYRSLILLVLLVALAQPLMYLIFGILEKCEEGLRKRTLKRKAKKYASKRR